MLRSVGRGDVEGIVGRERALVRGRGLDRVGNPGEERVGGVVVGEGAGPGRVAQDACGVPPGRQGGELSCESGQAP